MQGAGQPHILERPQISGMRQSQGRRDQAALWVQPTHQGLHADDFPLGIELGLVPVTTTTPRLRSDPWSAKAAGKGPNAMAKAIATGVN